MTLFDQPHIGFVIAAYGVAAIVVAVLIGATVLDYRAQLKALAAYRASDAATGHGQAPS